ncbi:hypothetical protein OJAV_G00186780 [Oryzias javanicus]|uniref:Uncharacterized protein n=1 Tax=Oryzias javanicus TaxID=123683 RepID=A0A437C9I5_ORYJA|nr:hypothetical protein OJAV_G00186780 [Oryzias javanicus]
MEGANLLKRRILEEGAELWSCKPVQKRLCVEAALQSVDCPMETSCVVTVTGQHQQVRAVHLRPPALCCARCLGGEPGHINHIMGL